MKTAISVPDLIFEEAERVARRMKRSRSELYSAALADYLARHTPDRVTEAMNRALAALDDGADEFVAAVSRRTLKRAKW
jgi:metal-responsive CopG/Arc/MetJ family transcriptional regulator